MNTALSRDTDGFVALVDATSYRGFIGPEWTLTQIFDRFDEQVAVGNLAVWQVGDEVSWTQVEVRDAPTDRPAIESFAFQMNLSGGLWLTTYTDLTMVAQFDDEHLADQDETTLILEPGEGPWVVTLRRLSVTVTDEDGNPDVPVTEVVVTRGTCESPVPFPGRDAA